MNRSASHFVLLTMIMFLPSVSACSQLPADGVRQISEATTHYRAGRYAAAQRMMNLLIEKHADASGIAGAYYLRGMCHFQSKQTRAARQDLQQAVAKAELDSVRSFAHAQLGFTDYASGRYAQAARHFKSALELSSELQPRDEISYLQAICLQRSGDWFAARKSWPKVWTLFPDSQFAERARRQFAWPHEYFTIQCGAFSDASNASKLAEQLRSQKLEAVAQQVVDQKGARHVVFVGTFSRYSEVTAYLDRVRNLVGEAFVVP